mgnify:CR=1 FL=1
MSDKTPAERLEIIARLAAEGAIDAEYLTELIKQFKLADLRAAVVAFLQAKEPTDADSAG